MKRTPLLPGLLLAVAGLVPGSGAASAGGTTAPARDQGVTYRVGTGEVVALGASAADQRAHRNRVGTGEVRTHGARPETGTSPAAKAAAAPRVRAGFVPAGLPDRNEIRPSKVFGADDRYWIDDPAAYPWSAVCRVTAEFPDGSVLRGSAVLIGDRFALTAGHVVHDGDRGGFAETVTVVPAYDNGDAPFGVHTASDVTSFVGWTRDRDHDWDFALLRLDEAPGGATGWLGFGAYDDAYLAGLTVNTGGYPSDLYDGRYMLGATGVVASVLPGQLRLRDAFDAAPGQSGSGVWDRRDDGRFVVGVVSTETSTWNQVARITDAVYDALATWIDEESGIDFVVTAVGSTLPAEFEAPRPASATVTVANEGGVGARAAVTVYARDLLGERRALASRDVFVDGGDATEVGMSFTVPADLAGSTWVLEAEVNGDRAVPEADHDGNRRDGAPFVVLPAWRPLALGFLGRDVLGPGGVARHALSVPAGLAKLRLRLGGPRGSYAAVTFPGGSTQILSRGRTVRVAAPAGGTWFVEIRSTTRLSRPRVHRFKARA